jgi:hypothetical protein
MILILHHSTFLVHYWIFAFFVSDPKQYASPALFWGKINGV